jgi:hypothetical protein
MPAYLTVDSWKWRDQAACTGMDEELFNVETGDLPMVQKVCDRCPVRDECLKDALALESVGYVRGGVALGVVGSEETTGV